MSAPDAVAPPPGHPRFKLMDALRAIAALGVLVSHAAYFSGAAEDAWYGILVANGATGVTVFFVLSGFLLYRPFLASEIDGAPRVRLIDFGRRRVLRIVPAYWVALTILAIYPGLIGVFTGDWWRYYGLLQVYGSGDEPLQGHGGRLEPVRRGDVLRVAPALRRPDATPRARPRARRADPAGARRARGVFGGASVIIRAISLAAGGSMIELTLVGTFAWFAVGMALAALSVGPAPAGPGPVHHPPSRRLLARGRGGVCGHVPAAPRPGGGAAALDPVAVVHPARAVGGRRPAARAPRRVRP